MENSNNSEQERQPHRTEWKVVCMYVCIIKLIKMAEGRWKCDKCDKCVK
jgi:hypothetical protein